MAAFHGKCVGSGPDIISACDLRLFTVDAEFSLREARIGIVAAMGTSSVCPLLLARCTPWQMAYTGRIFSVSEAGLVIEVYPDIDTMMSATKGIAD
ncbi:MAG: hypothetical protein JXB42_12545 [Deltaproteobacteria bacterium]|nr:hypothetical protein [Deltaproteobacteria bacterium]